MEIKLAQDLRFFSPCGRPHVGRSQSNRPHGYRPQSGFKLCPVPTFDPGLFKVVVEARHGFDGNATQCKQDGFDADQHQP